VIGMTGPGGVMKDKEAHEKQGIGFRVQGPGSEIVKPSLNPEP
jgi:hypothetical protein